MTSKTKLCPCCKEKYILPFSNFCYSCAQLGKRNRIYKDGHSCKDRKCSICGNKISSGSKTGRCKKCYLGSINGKNNPNYSNGIYANNLLSTVEYKTWKLSVFNRDDRVCALCGIKDKGHTFHAHHIIPKRERPDLIFDINNGITLCKECHESINNKEYLYIEQFTSIVHAKLKFRELGEPCYGNT